MAKTSLRYLQASPDEYVVCLHPGCRADPEPGAPTPLCTHHLRLVFAFVLGSAELVPGETPEPDLDPAVEGWVYFIRKADLIKVGWSSCPPVRFKALRPDEVLHLEPGTMRDERRCHAAFSHLREHGEWFRMEPDLLAFIDSLRVGAA